MPKKKTSFLSPYSVKSYIKDVAQMRSQDSTVKALIDKVDATVVSVIEYAKKLAKGNKRNTIMVADITAAIEHYIGKGHLTWQETADEVIRQNPTGLGQIIIAIKDYIKTHKK